MKEQENKSHNFLDIEKIFKVYSQLINLILNVLGKGNKFHFGLKKERKNNI